MVSDHFTLLLKPFHWLPILFRLKSETLTLAYTALHDDFLLYSPSHLWAHSHEQAMHALNSQCFAFTVPSFGTFFPLIGAEHTCLLCPGLFICLTSEYILIKHIF